MRGDAAWQQGQLGGRKPRGREWKKPSPPHIFPFLDLPSYIWSSSYLTVMCANNISFPLEQLRLCSITCNRKKPQLMCTKPETKLTAYSTAIQPHCYRVKHRLHLMRGVVHLNVCCEEGWKPLKIRALAWPNFKAYTHGSKILGSQVNSLGDYARQGAQDS